jgi:hypothetical protein
MQQTNAKTKSERIAEGEAILNGIFNEELALA